jgi:hypothetical protein
MNLDISDMEHTTFRNGKLFCLNCGGEFNLPYPVAVGEMTKKIKSFNALHKDCKKTWTEPIADQRKGIKEKAMWWIANGETGCSSKTMWSCFMGNNKYRIDHPYDPDDFSRCYKLLEAVPEWKSQLHRLKPLSKQWSNLVDNWDKLTDMFEENRKTNWKNSKQIGMYEFMQLLIA